MNDCFWHIMSQSGHFRSIGWSLSLIALEKFHSMHRGTFYASRTEWLDFGESASNMPHWSIDLALPHWRRSFFRSLWSFWRSAIRVSTSFKWSSIMTFTVSQGVLGKYWSSRSCLISLSERSNVRQCLIKDSLSISSEPYKRKFPSVRDGAEIKPSFS